MHVKHVICCCAGKQALQRQHNSTQTRQHHVFWSVFLRILQVHCPAAVVATGNHPMMIMSRCQVG
jgi:hypothetical protein